MPILNGFEFLKKVRARTETQKVPFLMVTTEAEKQRMLDAMSAGVNGYLVKPFPKGALMEALKRIWDRQQKSEKKNT